MQLWCLQHFEPEEAGLIGVWAAERGHPMNTVHLYRGDPLPELSPGDGLVIMGGPMNVDEDQKYSWLAPEKAFIARHIAAGGHVFGVCLGGQLIARALGGRVFKMPQKEIGWHDVHIHPQSRLEGPFKGFPETLTALQWHGDTFEIPEGVVHAASSDVCPSQAFNIGNRVIGLQFHFEAESREVHDFVSFFDWELEAGGPHVQTPSEILGGLPKYAKPCRDALFSVLDRWVQ